jgi:hypothetical protein
VYAKKCSITPLSSQFLYNPLINEGFDVIGSLIQAQNSLIKNWPVTLLWLYFGFFFSGSGSSLTMVIGNLTGFAPSGYGSGLRSLRETNQEREPVNQRQPVTLDAQLDPKTSNEYSVAATHPTLPPPERVSDDKSLDRRTRQNSDPASRAFLSVANYSSTTHKIDVRV